MSDDAPVILFVPGLNGSCPDHWQSRWEAELRDAQRVEQDDWHDPRPDDWIGRLEAAIRAATTPVVLVAHSLGCATVARWAEGSTVSDRVGAALLVAPCDVERPGSCQAIARFAPMSLSALPFRATVVASHDDPYVSFDRAHRFAERWGAEFVDAGTLGHINAASNLGEWRFGQRLLDDLISTSSRQSLRTA